MDKLNESFEKNNQDYDDIPDDFEDVEKTTPTKILKRVRKVIPIKVKTSNIQISGGAATLAAEAKIKARQNGGGGGSENAPKSDKQAKWGHDFYEAIEKEKEGGGKGENGQL